MAKSDSSTKVEKTTTKKSKFNKTYVVIAVLVLLLAGGGYVAYSQYDELKQENQRLSDPQEAARSETERIKGEIAALIEVPSDEEPTIATVVDPDKLGDQAFFANAQKDDRVVIYGQAKKAILYRPSTKKIIEVAPLNIGENATNNPGTTAPETSQPAVDLTQ